MNEILRKAAAFFAQAALDADPSDDHRQAERKQLERENFELNFESEVIQRKRPWR
jgi:hypothetical protein